VVTDLNSKSILKNQKNLFLIILCLVLALAGMAYYAIMQDAGHPSLLPQPKLELPGDKINPQEIWMSRMDSENKILKKHLEYIEGTLLELKKGQDEKNKENDDLKKEIAKLRNELKISSSKQNLQDRPMFKKEDLSDHLLSTLNTNKPQIKLGTFTATEDPFITTKSEINPSFIPQKPIFKELVMAKAKRNISHVDKAVPGGTTVKALLTSSIDAPCSIYSKNDPQPVKLRILDNGHLPKEVEAKIKGGIIIASAYGDISTERVCMRIERFTKVEPNGEFVETSVTGFISGEDGKFGVRGTVVDKSEKIVTNAARSGFLGGMSSILQSAVSRHEVNQFSFDVVKSTGPLVKQ
jgi:conjugal transfer pilus assembly protein TraB